MRVLVIGSGGREHALAWSLKQAEHHVSCVPGNAGTTSNRSVSTSGDQSEDIDAMVALACREHADLVVVGPEAPLVAGLVDALTAQGIAAFGPSAACAELEGSKAYAKAAMQRWGVPTARSVTVSSLEAGLAALESFDDPPVIKASGLAAGKGVIVPAERADAIAALETMFVHRAFGAAADEVLLEQRLFGREVSVLAICSGSTYRLLLPAQDHKRLLDGDRGPNTGGMGAFAPADTLSASLLKSIGETAIAPILDGMVASGTPYVGVLYAGIMLTAAGPQVLEYNCRFGDPEAQVILPLLEDDPAELFLAAVHGRLSDVALRWRRGAAATVVMAAAGYPEHPRRGDLITGIAAAQATGCVVFHAGTAPSPEGPRTAGGRVLAVTGLGATVADAAAAAYEGVECISFNGAHYRTDIGRSASASRGVEAP